MKRIGITLFVLLIGYSLFYDITIGTLPLLKPKAQEATAQPAMDSSTSVQKQADAKYKQIEVKSGDTVLSIVEAINKKGTLPAVDTITNDFKKLNTNESPSKIRIGKTYKFPLYK